MLRFESWHSKDEGLTPQFTFDSPMGGAVDDALILEPDGAKYKATISIMDGGFLIPGEATKH